MKVVLDPSFRVLAPLAHCEGVATGPDGALYAGDEGGRVFRVDPADGSVEQVGDVGGWALGLCLDAAGRVYVCVYDAGGVVRLDPRSGSTELYAGGFAAPNFPVFAPDGTLYVSDSGTEDPAVRDGRLFRVPPGGDPEQLDLPVLHFPNGLAHDGADGTLYILESYTPRLLALRDGELSVAAELPDTVPDGLALDAEGGIVVACYQPNRVLRIAPDGTQTVLLDDWMGAKLITPTNAAYYGPELRSLAVASLCGWTLSAIDTPWAGAPLAYPEI